MHGNILDYLASTLAFLFKLKMEIKQIITGTLFVNEFCITMCQMSLK